MEGENAPPEKVRGVHGVRAGYIVIMSGSQG